MSDLPDLDTSSVGYVAFWNFIDQGGAGEIDPTEVTSDGGVQSYTTYDNGVEGVYAAGTRDCTFRVKQDGWMIAYFDRKAEEQQYGSKNENLPTGTYSIVANWDDGSAGASSGDNNALERVINSLYNQLSNKNTATYSAADVGLYNYEVGGTTTTILTDQQDSPGNDDQVRSATPTFQYTSETSLGYAFALGALDFHSGDGSVAGEVTWGSGPVQLCPAHSSSGGTHFDYRGTVDLIANNEIPNANTEYSGYHDVSSYYSNDVSSKLSVVTIWA